MTLAKNQIHQGDCLQLFSQLDQGSVDLVFADPPFNIGYSYDVYDDKRQTTDYLDWCREWIGGVARCLKSDGTFWLAIGDEYAAELKVISQELGFSCRSWVIWYYTFGVNCVRGFSRSHTHLFHFVKDPEHFTFNADNPRVRVKSARELVYADKRANPKGRLPDNTWIYRPQDAPESFRPDHDTWYFSRVAGTFKEREGFHGCQMPEQLLGRIIRVSSNPTDLVVDPFSGSGTTVSVAKKLGRQWMGFELSEEYAEYSSRRAKNTQIGEPLDGPEDPLKSAPATSKGKRRRTTKSGDHELEQGILSAFDAASQGNSADYLLCDPELNEAFVKACKQRGLPGGDRVWNQQLLRLRKAKKLPKSTHKRKRLSFAEMDSYSFASEIALRLLTADYDLTLDSILCSREFAAEFDRIAAEFAPGYTPFEYRWAAMALRKRAGLQHSRKLATETFKAWMRKKLPNKQSLSECDLSQHREPGVYLLSTPSHDLYVGESENVGARIEKILGNPSWEELDPTSITIIPAKSSEKHGLQSVLVARTGSLLNSHLLCRELNRVAR